jgi:hypothetical protein
MRHFVKMFFDTPRDLRHALPNAGPILRCLSRSGMPAWIRQPRKYFAALVAKH